MPSQRNTEPYTPHTLSTISAGSSTALTTASEDPAPPFHGTRNFSTTSHASLHPTGQRSLESTQTQGSGGKGPSARKGGKKPCSGTRTLSCFQDTTITQTVIVNHTRSQIRYGSRTADVPITSLPFCETEAAFKTIQPSPFDCTDMFTTIITQSAISVYPTFIPPRNKTHPRPSDQGHYSDCKGTLTIDDGVETITVTSTTTIASGTITMGSNRGAPTAVIVFPIPYCFTTNACHPYCPVALHSEISTRLVNLNSPKVTYYPETVSTSTLLVTLKIPEATYYPETVSSMWPAPESRFPPIPTETPNPPPPLANEHQGVTSHPEQDQGDPAHGNNNPSNPAPADLPSSPPANHGDDHGNLPPQEQPSSNQGINPQDRDDQPQVHGQPSSDPGNGRGSSDPSDITGAGAPGAAGGVGNDGSGIAEAAAHPASNEGLGGTGGGKKLPLPAAQTLLPTKTSINGLPISIGANGFKVGDAFVPTGSSPRTMSVDGHLVTIEPSRIIIEGTTLPILQMPQQDRIQTSIAGLPVQLAPDSIVLAGKTYPADAQPTSVVIDGHTFQIVGTRLTEGSSSLEFPPSQSAPHYLTAGGQVFSLYPSALAVPGLAVELPHDGKASQFDYKGQTFAINPSQLIATARTAALPEAAEYTPFVYEGETFTISKDVLVGPTATSRIVSGHGSFTYQGQVIRIDGQTVKGPSTTIDLSNFANPSTLPSPSRTFVDGIALSIGPVAAVIGTKRYSFLPGQSSTQVLYKGHTFHLNEHGIALPHTTVSISPHYEIFSTVTEGDLTFSVDASDAVIAGKTYHIRPGMAPVTTVINGQTISIGPQGIGMSGTTAVFPTEHTPQPTNKEGYAVVTKDGIVFSLQPSDVVINGRTYSIGSGAMPTTINVGNEEISLGPGGIGLPKATITPPVQVPEVITEDGVMFTLRSTGVIIDGTTYSIGPGVTKTTITEGDETIIIGPGRVGFENTTFKQLSTTEAASAPPAIAQSSFSAAPISSKKSGASVTWHPLAHRSCLVITMMLGYMGFWVVI